MTTAVQCAQADLGYEETGGSSGHNGNRTKYWAQLDPALQGSYWCAVAVSAWFLESGDELPAIDKPYGYVDCADAVRWAKANGVWDESGHYPSNVPIFFCFDGSGVADHTGIVVSDDGTTIVTIEGNTTPPGGHGDPANGGGVYRKTHRHGSQVLGVMRTDRLPHHVAKASPTPASKPGQSTAPSRTAPSQPRPATSSTVQEDDVTTYYVGKTKAYPGGVIVALSAAGKTRVTPDEYRASVAPQVKAGLARLQHVADGVLDTIADAA